MSEFKSRLSFLVIVIVVTFVILFTLSVPITIYREKKSVQKEEPEKELYYVTLLTERGDTILHLYTPYQPIPSEMEDSCSGNVEIWIDRGGKLDVWTNLEEGGWIRK